MAVPVRRPALALLGTLLVIAALGLPWNFDSRSYVSGWIVPGFCIPSMDGTMYCSAATISPGFVLGSGAASGAQTPARVFLVAALVLVAFGVRRSSARLFAFAGGAVLVGVFLTGPVVLGGPIAATLGGVLLLRSTGARLLPVRSRIRSMRSRAGTSPHAAAPGGR